MEACCCGGHTLADIGRAAFSTRKFVQVRAGTSYSAVYPYVFDMGLIFIL